MAPDFLFNLKPTAMYTLLKTGLLLFFRESDLPTGTVSEAHLSELFEEFIQELTAYSSDDRRSIIERLRCMSFTLGQVSLLEKRKNRISESLLTDYMVRTLFLIDTEVRLLHLRLRYPQSGIVPEVKIESPLYLSKDLTVTDLVELLYALHLIGASIIYKTRIIEIFVFSGAFSPDGNLPHKVPDIALPPTP